MYFNNDDSYEQWTSSSDVNFVSPQNLINTATTSQTRGREAPTKVDLSGSKISQVCFLEPGKRHQLSQAHEPIPTPLTIMNGEYEAALRSIREGLDVVTIIPRKPEHCGYVHAPSIVFSLRGRPGVYLYELETAQIDNGNDPVFESMGWKRTRVEVDWPGIQRITRNNYIPCLPNQGFYTRQEVAREIGKQVREVILPASSSRVNYARQEIKRHTRRWDIRYVDYYKIRILGISYYQNWVPILAIDDKD